MSYLNLDGAPGGDSQSGSFPQSQSFSPVNEMMGGVGAINNNAVKPSPSAMIQPPEDIVNTSDPQSIMQQKFSTSSSIPQSRQPASSPAQFQQRFNAMGLPATNKQQQQAHQRRMMEQQQQQAHQRRVMEQQMQQQGSLKRAQQEMLQQQMLQYHHQQQQQKQGGPPQTAAQTAKPQDMYRRQRQQSISAPSTASSPAIGGFFPNQPPQASPYVPNKAPAKPPNPPPNAQVELFVGCLQDFMRRRGTPITQNPVVGGKRIHLFFLYILVSKLGGSASVSRNNQWNFVAQKFGLDNGAGPQLSSVYAQCLALFEQYASSPEGQRDLYTRKMNLQAQAQLASNSSQPSPQIPASATSPPSRTGMEQRSSPRPFAVPYSSGFPPGRPNQASSSSRHGSQNSPVVPTPAPPAARIPSRNAQQSPPATQHSPVVEPRSPTCKNYVPHQKVLERYAGIDLDALNNMGEHIDASKPVFLFVPELGNIDVHALTLSIASGITGEVNSALNTLLAVSADSNVEFSLTNCPELLDELSQRGAVVLDELCLSKHEKSVLVENLKESTVSDIDLIFQSYVTGQDEEDITFTVDSFTGDAINGHSENIYPVAATESKQEFQDTMPDRFEMPSYMSLLRSFKDEVEQPFSNVHTKSSMDHDVMLVEQLHMISMIIRNLSFSPQNATVLATNEFHKTFVFKLLYTLTTSPQIFKFERKKLILIKDCAVVLSNISHLMHLRNTRDALLAVLLCVSLGEVDDCNLHDSQSLNIPPFEMNTHRYQQFGIDIFAKLIVREVPNKQLMIAVLRGNFHMDMSAPMSDFDIKTSRLFDLNCNGNKRTHLLQKSFRFLLSPLPLKSLLNGSNLFDEKLPITFQSLLALNVILEQICYEMDENLCVEWLSSLESIGFNLWKLSVLLTMLSLKMSGDAALCHTLILLSERSLGVLNHLIAGALDFNSKANGDLSQLISLPKLFPHDESLLIILTNFHIDPRISKQAVRLIQNLHQLGKAV